MKYTNLMINTVLNNLNYVTLNLDGKFMNIYIYIIYGRLNK